MVRLDGVTFSYKGAQVLCGVSLEAKEGSITAITGENGGGKTTLMRIIAGTLRAQSGTVFVDGTVGYVPQTPSLFEDMTVRENLRFFADLCGGKVPEILPMGVEGFAGKRVSSLSGGMKKRTSIACALLGDPQILLLDEPAASLDAAGKAELASLSSRLKENGRLIIYIGHNAEEYEDLCDSHYYLEGGILTRKGQNV